MSWTVDGSGDTEPESTLGSHFDFIYKKLMESIQAPEPSFTLDEQDVQFHYFQMELEKITNEVSALDMFSKNESFEEIPPLYIKFLLLPYLLGTLWSLKDGAGQRKEAIQMAQIYFRDFLERLLRHGMISTPPPVLKIFEGEGGDGDSAAAVQPKVPSITPEEKRRLKIAKYKETKELEQKVEILQRNNAESMDDGVVQEVWLLLMKKYAIDAENQLESILKETELLLFGEARAQGKMEAEPGPVKPLSNAPPFSLFILTKSELQKQVYGAGYPSLPIMTVDELYEQRRKEGTWGPPPSTSQQQHQGSPPEEDPSAEREAQEDTEDTVARLQQLELDEYKDMHRRGWGNRMNRS